ncbi:hypothetical protein [Streptomyces sp. NPDC060031]|uniref:hypothetical protein n=1 Tax=Streptomyces sp. NPDC060031 TaxID=3347043 RepID=UPI00369DBC85
MRGDETQRGVAPGAESRERKGPRHAAPRKSLLTKIQIPVGKTMALAAMPTAVFVGMGMAPKLAMADDKEIPFAPGPCVTRSDEPAEADTATPSPSKSPSKTPSPSASPTATPSPGVTPSASKPVSASAEKPAQKPAAKPAEQPAAKQAAPVAPVAPSASKTVNPLDPLGVGDKLKGLLDELGKPLTGAGTAAAPAPATPSKPAATPAPEPSADAIRDAAKKAGAEVSELSKEVKDTATTPKDETGKTADDTADDKAEDASDDKAEDASDDKADDAEPTPGASKDADGKEPFPCPTYDAKALADAELEPGIPLLPDDPWYLNSSLLALYGLDYHGIVEVKTAGGKTKKVLKFTADSLDIKDLYQTVGKEGKVAHLKSRPGSTSKIRGATVTMYTESLKGNLFGLIPIEFTPNSPPPLNVPFAFFTNVKVVQAGQFGGTLTVPGLKNYIGPPE